MKRNIILAAALGLILITPVIAQSTALTLIDGDLDLNENRLVDGDTVIWNPESQKIPDDLVDKNITVDDIEIESEMIKGELAGEKLESSSIGPREIDLSQSFTWDNEHIFNHKTSFTEGLTAENIVLEKIELENLDNPEINANETCNNDGEIVYNQGTHYGCSGTWKPLY